MATRRADVFQILTFLDIAEPHRWSAAASDLLVFTGAASLRGTHGYARDALTFAATAGASGDQSRSVAQALSFTQVAYRRRDGYVYQNLVLAQSTDVGEGVRDDQSLVFSQSASLVRVRPGGDSIAFTDAATAGAVRVRPGSSSLAFKDFATAYLPKESFVAVVTPTITPSASVTLDTPAGSMTLPPPDFGNTEALGQTRVQRNTRGGTFIVFRPSYWPTTDEFDLTFSYLSEAQVHRLRSLAAGSVGLLCTYTDHEGHAWSVIVTNPDVVVTQVGRQNYTAGLKLLVAS